MLRLNKHFSQRSFFFKRTISTRSKMTVNKNNESSVNKTQSVVFIILLFFFSLAVEIGKKANVCNETSTNTENFHRMHTGKNQEHHILSFLLLVLSLSLSFSLFDKTTAIPFNRSMGKRRGKFFFLCFFF